MPGVIVPRKTVGELRKLLDDDDAAIAVSVSETKVRIEKLDRYADIGGIGVEITRKRRSSQA